MKAVHLVLIFCVLPWFVYSAICTKANPRVRVLYTGDPYPGVTPYIHMRVEPLLEVTPVQASRQHYAGITISDIKRAIRIYMPRTYQSLVGFYDVVIISDAHVASFTGDHLFWFKRSVEEDSMGLVMIGGYETFGGTSGATDWGTTPVGDVLPVETIPDLYWGGPLTIIDTENIFMGSLPWRPNLPFMRDYESNLVKEKEGAEILAVVTIGPWGQSYAGYRNPFFSTWIYEKGRIFAMTGDWTPAGGWYFLQWDYLPDFVTNLMLYCAQRPVPQDLSLIHTLRMKMATLGYRGLIITSLLDFVERFGANPKKVLLVLGEVDEARERAAQLYLEQSYAESLEAVNMALGLMDKAEYTAEKAKAEALFWVHVVEWVIVASSGLVTGVIAWSLMIRKRMYRPVETTRMKTLF